MKNVINLSIFLFLCCSLTAQDFNRPKLDSLFSVIDKKDKGMGSVSIFENGKEVYSNTIGFADIEAQKLANASTKYRIGSITKTFTATIIMLLVEEGKLSLDTKLSNFYPQIPNSDKINIENMLRHQSGLFNFSSAEDFEKWKYQEQSREDHLKRIVANGTTFEVGEKSEYSNTNYLLLSFIIEEIEGKNYSEVLNKKIIEPLGLKNTYYGAKLDPAKGEALSYQQTGSWTPIEETNMTVVKGAGAMISTPYELNYFFNALFAGKVVKKESLGKMKEVKGEFGLGMFPIQLVGKTFYGHTGGIDGFNSVVVYLPEENLSIAYTSNAREITPHKILDAVAHIYFNEDYELPSFKTINLTTEQLQAFEGTYGASDFPFKLSIFEENGQLMAQAEGQPSFPLEAYEENKFKFDRLGVKMEFHPMEDKMLFKQGPKVFELKRV